MQTQWLFSILTSPIWLLMSLLCAYPFTSSWIIGWFQSGLLWVSESRSVVSGSLWSHGLYSPWNSPDQNTGVGSHSLLQQISPMQGSNLRLLHCRQILYQLSHKRSSRILEWVAYPSSSRSSRSRNQTCIARVSCIASGFFTTWAIKEAPELRRMVRNAKWQLSGTGFFLRWC